MRAILVTGVAALLSCASCAPDACEGEAPALQLDLRANDPAIRSIVVALEYGGTTYQRAFDIDGALDDGRASLPVVLDGAPDDDFPIRVEVTAHDGANGAGDLVARGSETFDATPNACNVFDLALTGGVDGGVADGGTVDGGRPDGGHRDGGLGDGGDRDGGDRDGGDRDGGVRDGGDRDGGDRDGGVRDGGVRDGGVRDGGVPNTCTIPPDVDTVALYRFEGDADDETTNHDGVPSAGSFYEAGPFGCGLATAFGPGNSVGNFVEIPDSAAFDLGVGAIEASVYVASTTANRPRVFFSRDSSNEPGTGELTIGIACDGTVVATLEDGVSTVHRCSSNVVPAGQYVEVGVNFGPAGFALFVAGVPGSRTGMLGFGGVNCNRDIDCGGTSTGGIAGNDHPIVIGASNASSTPGTTDDLDSPLRDGRVDNLRISSTNRVF